nr:MULTISPECIES: helix-turn-helix domain-containing protein [unclassified Martelella]
MKRYARIRAVKESIPTAIFFGPGRQKRHSIVRQRAMYEIYIAFGASLPQIGVVFNRDHTTVLHAVRKIGQMIEDGLLPPVEPADVWAVLADDRALLAEESA